MIMEFKLIKLKEGYIIVSDKEIKEADIHINLLTKEIERASKNLSKNFIGNSNFNFSVRKQYKKIIASNFIPELPNIDFNDLEEEFGIVDIKKLASMYANKELNEEFTSKSGNFYGFYSSFLDGFNKCLELNKDKLYTLEDMRNCFIAGERYQEDWSLNQIGEKEEILEYDFGEYIQSLQPKTEWDIEVEEYCSSEDCILFGCQKYEGCKHENLQKLKIIDNKIKITKIL